MYMTDHKSPHPVTGLSVLVFISSSSDDCSRAVRSVRDIVRDCNRSVVPYLCYSECNDKSNF